MDGFEFLAQVVPTVGTATVAIVAILDGRRRLKEQEDHQAAQAKEQRRADVIKLGLDYALRRKFELIDRVAQGAARYEGLLQYRGNLEVDPTPEGFQQLNALTGGHEEWGSYRAAAHELGDGDLEKAAIGLGNLVSSLLVRRPDLHDTRQATENRAYETLTTLWARLASLRMDVEHQLSPK